MSAPAVPKPSKSCPPESNVRRGSHFLWTEEETEEGGGCWVQRLTAAPVGRSAWRWPEWGQHPQHLPRCLPCTGAGKGVPGCHYMTTPVPGSSASPPPTGASALPPPNPGTVQPGGRRVLSAQGGAFPEARCQHTAATTGTRFASGGVARGLLPWSTLANGFPTHRVITSALHDLCRTI